MTLAIISLITCIVALLLNIIAKNYIWIVIMILLIITNSVIITGYLGGII